MARITFLVHKGKEYPVRKYRRSWGRGLWDRVTVHHYPGLGTLGPTPFERLEQTVRAIRVGSLRPPLRVTGVPQIYVFADLDRLDQRETGIAIRLWETLREHPDTALLLNHPGRAMQRFELLDTLHRQGRNRFAVYRAGEGVVPARWPVFLRNERGHGHLTRLLHGPAELQRELARAAGEQSRVEDRDRKGRVRAHGEKGLDDKLIVELCDTADERGIVRKYGAFRIGDRVLARQIHFSREWMVRFPDIREEATAREELEYVESNPHASELLEIFETARVDYGRVDYSLTDGQIQVWEINTNPMIVIPADRKDPLRFSAHNAFGRAFTAALEELLDRYESGGREGGGREGGGREGEGREGEGSHPSGREEAPPPSG